MTPPPEMDVANLGGSDVAKMAPVKADVVVYPDVVVVMPAGRGPDMLSPPANNIFVLTF